MIFRFSLSRMLVLGILFFSASNLPAQDNPKLHYAFNLLPDGSVKDESGNGYSGKLLNGASVYQKEGMGFLSLGDRNGYLDMGTAVGNLVSVLGDFSVATCLYIDPAATITGDGNFLWAFATSASCSQSSGKYAAFRVNQQRYALSTGGWSNEKAVVSAGTAVEKGAWMHLCYTQSGTTGTLYVNGKVLKTATVGLPPANLGTATAFNFIGRSPFSGDNYLKMATLNDFRLYDKALDPTSVSVLAKQCSKVEAVFSNVILSEAFNRLQLSVPDTITTSFRLPGIENTSIQLSWESSDPSVLSPEGIVVRPACGKPACTVQLTAKLNYGGATVRKSFSFVVLPYASDADCVQLDAAGLNVNEGVKLVRNNLRLPLVGKEGSTITWSSSKPDWINNLGELVRMPEKNPESVRLTAVVSKGSSVQTRVFDVTVPVDDKTCYLFAYFTGNSGDEESLRFSLSPDGLNYRALNNNLPIIASDTIAEKLAIRDPHIYRGVDGWFTMVVTDMKSANGWSSNHGMVFLKSKDLVNWSASKVDVAALFPQFSAINRCWAPQTIWDPQVGKYMVYWSMRSYDEPDIIYYSYANDDFTSLETEPKVLFNHPKNVSCIDGDIVYKDGLYYLIFKDEGAGKGIKQAVSKSLTGPYTMEYERYLQQTTAGVEGACVFPLINSDTWVLIYDVYTAGRYEFTYSKDLRNFKMLNGVSMNFAPRHGTVLQISDAEAAALAARWGKSSDLLPLTATAPEVKKLNLVVDKTARTVYLPLRRGTNLRAFDPGLKAMPGVTVSPSGPQNFSKGAVTYTLSLNGAESAWTVTAAVNNNPVLTDLYADPEILYSEKNRTFYLYPTSDGYAGWCGASFTCFSSDNLVDWKEEGTIVDLATDDVTWANLNAWAPCIVEKKINGQYKYFYYFSAGKKIGVAVADKPTGPFKDSGKPLIDFKPTGVNRGQEIDPDVFTDPVSGKSYLYWGNGYMAGVELNDDMTSIKKETMRDMTPDATYREATYVFYRNGLYYFLWSEDDTGSPNYKVRYATSTQPLGALTIPTNNVVIRRKDERSIFGTGHNSVLQMPGKDEWYIVYHRLTRPKGITYRTPGYFREVCIDRMTFDGEGRIQETTPTLEGIAPVSVATGFKRLFLKR